MIAVNSLGWALLASATLLFVLTVRRWFESMVDLNMVRLDNAKTPVLKHAMGARSVAWWSFAGGLCWLIFSGLVVFILPLTNYYEWVVLLVLVWTSIGRVYAEHLTRLRINNSLLDETMIHASVLALTEAIESKHNAVLGAINENTVLTDLLVQRAENTEKKVEAGNAAIDGVDKKTDGQTLKIDAVNANTEVIKGHVNSEKTAAEGREATLTAENKLLREMLNAQERTAALLAQAKATPTLSTEQKV